MTEWQQVHAALDAVEAAIRQTWEDRLEWAYANPTGHRLRELEEKRAALAMRLDEIGRRDKVVRLVPRNKAPMPLLGEAVG